MAFGLGFILGPALGGVLSQISLAAPAYAAGTLSLLSAIVGFFVLPESLPREQRTSGAFRWREINPLGAVVAMARRPALGALLANQVAPQEQGQVAGVGTALSGLMSVFGPLWAGAAYDRLAPGAPFWSGALVLLLAVIVLTPVRAAQAASNSASTVGGEP